MQDGLGIFCVPCKHIVFFVSFRTVKVGQSKKSCNFAIAIYCD